MRFSLFSSATSGGGVKYNAIARVPPLLQGHSTMDANGINNSHPWDPNHPLFFSGTNCSISGTAMAYKTQPGIYPARGTFVMQASLSIGGTAGAASQQIVLVSRSSAIEVYSYFPDTGLLGSNSDWAAVLDEFKTWIQRKVGASAAQGPHR